MTMLGGRLLDRDLQIVAGGNAPDRRPFWFQDTAGGMSITAGATERGRRTRIMG